MGMCLVLQFPTAAQTFVELSREKKICGVTPRCLSKTKRPGAEAPGLDRHNGLWNGGLIDLVLRVLPAPTSDGNL